MLPQNREHIRAARVVDRTKNQDGKVIGNHNPNPILDTRVYNVMFPDGSIQQYAANIIAEHMYSQVEEDVHRYQLLESIINHCTNGRAVHSYDGWTTAKKGRKSRKHTTKCWFMYAEWKDGTKTWVPLKYMKQLYPVQVAEYSESNKLMSEPTFAWWTPFTLKKREQIFGAVKAHLNKKTHKYGVLVPNMVKEAYMLNKEAGNTLWRDSISK